jgi:hypothetical protein
LTFSPDLIQLGEIKERIMKELTKEQIDAFDDLLCRLSPENLNCDGEISAAQAQRKYRQIIKEWEVLEKQVGRKVSQDEIYSIVLGV